eukprot:g11032.t1
MDASRESRERCAGWGGGSVRIWRFDISIDQRTTTVFCVEEKIFPGLAQCFVCPPTNAVRWSDGRAIRQVSPGAGRGGSRCGAQGGKDVYSSVLLRAAAQPPQGPGWLASGDSSRKRDHNLYRIARRRQRRSATATAREAPVPVLLSPRRASNPTRYGHGSVMITVNRNIYISPRTDDQDINAIRR